MKRFLFHPGYEIINNPGLTAKARLIRAQAALAVGPRSGLATKLPLPPFVARIEIAKSGCGRGQG